MANKPGRETPYVLYFFLLSLLLIALSFWVIWFETVQLRPWKDYQEQYYALKKEKLESEYENALRAFQSPETTQRYNELKASLAQAENDLRNPDTQEKNARIEKELYEVQETLKRTKAEFKAVRGTYLEREYLYYKYQGAEDKASMLELEQRIASIEKQRRELSAKEDSLQQEQRVLSAAPERYAAEIRHLEGTLSSIERNLEKMDNAPIEIRQVYMEDINKADRCQSCHIGIDDPDALFDGQIFAQHPGRFIYLENHPPEDFGCTFCHRGQGRATSSPEKAHGWVEHWQDPMLTDNLVQASCQTCHGDVQHLRGGDLIRRGSELVEKYGCYGCHKIVGYESLREVGPELTEVGAKVNYTWMVDWLLDPGSYFDTARMPDFNFSREEAEAIADYLFSMTRETRIDYDPGEIDWDLADRGKAIWGQSRCSICHATNGVGGAFQEVYAPDLGKVGSKMNRTWLFRWIKDPKTYFPQTRMPRFRFTDEQISALVEYLMGEFVDWDAEPRYTEPVRIEAATIKKGKELIQNFGCFGCHDVKGMQEMTEIGPFLRRGEVTYLRVGEIGEKIGTELSSFGSKPVERFDFGKMQDAIAHDRTSYLQQKLRAPRSFRNDLRMPDFRLTEEEIEALTVLLTGFTDAEMPTRFKVPKQANDFELTGPFAKIEKDIKCLNCHIIRGQGSDFAPDLTIEGSKVQEQWLRRFLKQPDVIRPMLRQMPRFNLDHAQDMIQGNLTFIEIETTVQYFKHVLVSREIPETLPENELDVEGQIQAGRTLYEDKGCKVCHQVGVEGGAVGPNLTDVGNRLTEGYIFKHLEDPQALIPTIVEPNYGFSVNERISLTRYLMSLKAE